MTVEKKFIDLYDSYALDEVGLKVAELQPGNHKQNYINLLSQRQFCNVKA